MRKKILGLALGACLLSGCSLSEMVENGELETMIDSMLNTAVDTLLESNDNNGANSQKVPIDPTVGGAVTTPNPGISVPDGVEIPDEMYNESVEDGTFYFLVFADSVEDVEGGWSVQGMLMERCFLEEEALQTLIDDPEGGEFLFSYQNYDMTGRIFQESTRCKGARPAEEEDSKPQNQDEEEEEELEIFPFTYEKLDGTVIERSVREDGAVFDSFGLDYYVPGEFVSLHISEQAKLTDEFLTGISKEYQNLQEFYDYRATTNSFVEGRKVYDVDITVEEGKVTHVNGKYFAWI